VKEGQKLSAGEAVARVGEKELGATIHASIAGTVRHIGADAMVIEA
jgi:Na+-translocating ferredoxin:NAD+ oxidoreductase RnfC subunit